MLNLIEKEMYIFCLFQSFDLLMFRLKIKSCIFVSGLSLSVDRWIILTMYQAEVTKR